MAIAVKNSRRGGLLWLHLDWPARKVDRGAGREPRRWEMIIDLLLSAFSFCFFDVRDKTLFLNGALPQTPVLFLRAQENEPKEGRRV